MQGGTSSSPQDMRSGNLVGLALDDGMISSQANSTVNCLAQQSIESEMTGPDQGEVNARVAAAVQFLRSSSIARMESQVLPTALRAAQLATIDKTAIPEVLGV